MTGNGLGICEGGEFEIRQLGICTNVDRITNAQLLPSALLLQIPCYVLCFFSLE